MNDSYLKKVKEWEAEADYSVPRKARLKFGFFFLFLLFMVLVGFVIYALTYNVLLELLPDGHWNVNYIAALFIFIFWGICIYVSWEEKKRVQNWKKVVGKIVLMDSSMSRDKTTPTYTVSYEINENSYRKNFGKGVGGISGGVIGEPVVLLVDPENPNLCLSYSGSSWKAVKQEKDLIS